MKEDSGTRSSLDYGRSPRRRVTRNAWLCAVLVATIGVARMGWPTLGALWARVEFLRMQRQCMTYCTGPDTLVFRRGLGVPPAAPPGRAYAREAVWLNPPEFASSIMGTGNGVLDGNAFLHGRRSANRTERLVTVDAGDDLRCASRALSPWGSDPKLLMRSYLRGRGIAIQLADADALTVFGGQADENDEAHFTVALVVNDVRSVVDGRLADDGKVTLSPRDGLIQDEPETRAGGDLKWWPRGSTARTTRLRPRPQPVSP